MRRASHTPGPWGLVQTSVGPIVGHRLVHVATAYDGHGNVETALARANARLICVAPELLDLAKRYASECGECAGTRVCPDDEPCTECADIWRVIDKAEGRA